MSDLEIQTCTPLFLLYLPFKLGLRANDSWHDRAINRQACPEFEAYKVNPLDCACNSHVPCAANID